MTPYLDINHKNSMLLCMLLASFITQHLSFKWRSLEFLVKRKLPQTARSSYTMLRHKENYQHTKTNFNESPTSAKLTRDLTKFILYCRIEKAHLVSIMTERNFFSPFAWLSCMLQNHTKNIMHCNSHTMTLCNFQF